MKWYIFGDTGIIAEANNFSGAESVKSFHCESCSVGDEFGRQDVRRMQEKESSPAGLADKGQIRTQFAVGSGAQSLGCARGKGTSLSLSLTHACTRTHTH